jgi:hypothetical protein
MLRTTAVAVAAAALVASGAFAQTENGTNSSTVPIGGSVVNACTGEVVTYGGECHFVTHTMIKDDGSIESRGEMNCHAEGTSTSGNKYVYNYEQHTDFDDPAGCAAGAVNFTDTAVTRTLWVSAGAGDNFWSITRATATSFGCPRHGRPNPPVVTIETDTECRGSE